MEKLKMPETVAHHSVALVGGFFGVYSLLLRNENFGNSETANLIYLLASGLGGDLHTLRIRLGALFVYVAGLVLGTLLPKWMKGDSRYAAEGIDVICCIVLAFIPAGVEPVLALYPMFFAMAVQWIAFTSASGFNSATVFSTNNTRQVVAGLTEFVYTRDKKHLLRAKFFAGTLICFHIGVAYGYFCLQRWQLKSSLACIPLAGIAFVCTYLDRKSQNVVPKSSDEPLISS